jgi:biotin transport system substrate-specific component
MQVAARIDQAKYGVFRWRYELSLPMKLALALGFAGLTGLIAQLRFGWPVPITGQTFAVLLAGVLMGRWWGGVSMAMYVGLGAAGVPWFAPTAGMSAFTAGGISHLAGPTGGYLIGFVLAGLFLGYFTDRYVRSRSFLSMLGLMLFANFVLIYVPGLLQLHFWLDLVEGSPVSLATLLGIGAAPFIIGDIIKAVTAALIARSVTPKRAYGSEVDGDRWSSWHIP